MGTGKIVQVIGTVVDVEFPPDQLPNLFDALTLDNSGENLVLEVQQHVGNNWARCLALGSTDGLATRPVVAPADLTSTQRSGYIYEPDSLTVLGSLLPQFVEMQVYHALLESIASEQSARMVSMRNAIDNAKSLSDDLTLVMNKLRQDSITNELLDLIGGQAALEG